ncbi:MAG: TRAP transporter small permease [Desulfobacterales bacterium]|jgi:TRAP-type C4-dicarboxylate transport system permease small subunit
MQRVLSFLNNSVTAIEKYILAYGVICLAIITIGNVISRKAFNHSWSFAEELSQFILVIITFMGISYAARKSRHIRMTAFYEMVNDKIKKLLMILISIVTMVILFYLSYYALLFVLKVQDYGRVTPALRLPFYWMIMWAPIGLFLGGIQYLLTLIKNLSHKDVWLSFDEKSEYKDLPV